MSKLRGTYLVEFVDGTQIVCGNNYKTWLTHAREYAMYRFREGNEFKPIVNSVKFSDTPFVDDGGLKYATPEAYQEIIDEMTTRDGKQRTAFQDIEFSFSNADKKKIGKELAGWQS